MKTIGKMVKGLPIILTVVFLCGLIFSQSPVLANDQYERRIDQIDEALREGQIDLKTAVLRTARVLFSPHRAPQEGEDIGDETPRLALFEDVRRSFEELTVKEKSSLRSLSPDLARVIDEEESGGQPQQTPVSQRPPNTFDRVAKAYDHGEITLKEAVLLKARLLFVPHTIETQHPFSVQTGEVPVQEPCGTGFYVDVHRVFDQLTDEEIAFLKSLSPDLKVIMTAREEQRSGIVGSSRASALPEHPDLDQQEEGTKCIVHYALTGANAVPDKNYAELVRLYMDMAIENMTRDFTTAYAEGYPDYIGKMHVYIIDAPTVDGLTFPMSNVSGKKYASYIKIANAIDTRYGNIWQVVLKGVCFHEYFHAIQNAYNALADSWFAEGTSVWAEGYYGKAWAHVGSFYTASDSIFNKPNDVLWSTAGIRPYSTSALAFYLSDKFGGYNFIKSWLVNTETENDGIKTLQQTLVAKNTLFTEEYISFLASLCAKSIKSIKKYMPNVAILTEDEVYGVEETIDKLHLTGANFHLFVPEEGAKPGTFIATFTAGGTGVPKGALVTKKGNKVSAPMAFLPHISGSPTAYVGGFGKAIQEVILITTDATYAAKDTALRFYDYTAIVPGIFIRNVTAQSPIDTGDSSRMDIRYDLTGTLSSEEFPVQLKVVQKGPDVANSASELALPSGEDLTLSLWFNTTSSTHDGTYKFTFQLAVPPDSWLPIPQVKSKGKCSVLVKKGDCFPVWSENDYPAAAQYPLLNGYYNGEDYHWFFYQVNMTGTGRQLILTDIRSYQNASAAEKWFNNNYNYFKNPSKYSIISEGEKELVVVEWTGSQDINRVPWHIHAMTLHKNSFILISTGLCLAKEGNEGICDEGEALSPYTQTQLDQHMQLLNDAKALIDAKCVKKPVGKDKMAHVR